MEWFCPCGVSLGKLKVYEVIAREGRCDACLDSDERAAETEARY
jgi:hypothetical protein